LRGRRLFNCRPARDRLIFNNSGKEGSSCGRLPVHLGLPSARTLGYVLHRVLSY
jgi:hypothetical protein